MHVVEKDLTEDGGVAVVEGRGEEKCNGPALPHLVTLRDVFLDGI